MGIRRCPKVLCVKKRGSADSYDRVGGVWNRLCGGLVVEGLAYIFHL